MWFVWLWVVFRSVLKGLSFSICSMYMRVIKRLVIGDREKEMGKELVLKVEVFCFWGRWESRIFIFVFYFVFRN